MSLRSAESKEPTDEELLREYERFLSGKAEGTIEAYLRTIGHLMEWIAERPSHGHSFLPQQLTKTVVEMYLAQMEREGYSLNHRARVKSTISTFAHFLIEEKGLLQRNPTRGVDLPASRCLLLGNFLRISVLSYGHSLSKPKTDGAQHSLHWATGQGVG